MRKERRISRATEHFTTGETNARIPNDMSVDFGDGHVVDARNEGVDDPVAFTNDVHNEEHGRAGKREVG